MKIYPKIDERYNGLESLKNTIIKYKGVEIQFFNNDNIWGNYDIEKTIKYVMEKIPEIQEITVHPPLHDHDIEVIIEKDINIVKNDIQKALNLTKQFDLKINLLYHVTWPINKIEASVLEKIRELVRQVEGSNINILLENIHTLNENKKCTVLEICKRINSNNLKVCLDICHLHCVANAFKWQIEDYVENYIDKDLAQKYIYQIHFSDTKNNDGYIDKKTHGVKHDGLEEIIKDFEILKMFNIEQRRIVTEIAEENYIKRDDQKFEIELLEKIK